MNARDADVAAPTALNPCEDRLDGEIDVERVNANAENVDAAPNDVRC
jgi:hypothetical protein